MLRREERTLRPDHRLQLTHIGLTLSGEPPPEQNYSVLASNATRNVLPRALRTFTDNRIDGLSRSIVTPSSLEITAEADPSTSTCRMPLLACVGSDTAMWISAP